MFEATIQGLTAERAEQSSICWIVGQYRAFNLLANFAYSRNARHPTFAFWLTFSATLVTMGNSVLL